MDKEEKSKLGKKSRNKGRNFEKKVREELTKEGFIVCRFDNNVEFQEGSIVKISGDEKIIKGTDKITKEDYKEGKLIQAKKSYNPFTKRLGYANGFPDFVIFAHKGYASFGNVYEVIGCEVKSNGYLDKLEKEKLEYYLKNKIFSKILIAKHGLKRGKIDYEEFKIKD